MSIILNVRGKDTLVQGSAEAPSDTGLQSGSPAVLDPEGRPHLDKRELAVNSNSADPCIWLRNSKDQLVKFRPTSDLAWVENEVELAAIASRGDPPRAGDAYLVRHPLSQTPAQNRLAIWDPQIGAKGDWNWDVLQRVRHRALRSDPLPQPVGPEAQHLVDGDLLFTEETDHRQIHLWNGTAWLLLWDDDEIRELCRRDRGLNIVGRRNDLPVPAIDAPIWDGQQFLVRMDFAGQPLNRIYTWHELTPPGLGFAQTGEWISTSLKDWVLPLRSDANPATDRELGDLRFTTERDHEETWVFDGTTWQNNYSADRVKAWIAALNLFEGTTVESGHAVAGAVEFSALPDLTLNRSEDAALSAHYWTFVGTPGLAIDASNGVHGLDADLHGALLNPGDWLQVVNRGTDVAPDLHWVHIGGDLLAKSRADLLYGLKPWAAGSWEQGSLVLHDGDLYRALRGVVAADPQPNAAVVAPATQPWELVPLSGGMKIAQTDPGGGAGSLPDSAPAGQVWIVLQSAAAGGKQALFAYDTGAAKWQQLGGGGIPLDLTGGIELIGVGLPIGSITAYVNVNNPPPGWLLCDGSPIPAQYKELIAVCGPNTPDLRDQFIRGAKAQTEIWDNGFKRYQDTTRLPRKPFVADAAGAHQHTGGGPTIASWAAYGQGEGGNREAWSGGTAWGRVLPKTSSAGSHTHAISGGDSETAPTHVRMAYIVKAADRFVRGRTL